MVIDDVAMDATDGYPFQLSHSPSLLEHVMMEHSLDCFVFSLVLSHKHALNNLQADIPF